MDIDIKKFSLKLEQKYIENEEQNTLDNVKEDFPKRKKHKKNKEKAASNNESSVNINHSLSISEEHNPVRKKKKKRCGSNLDIDEENQSSLMTISHAKKIKNSISGIEDLSSENVKNEIISNTLEIHYKDLPKRKKHKSKEKLQIDGYSLFVNNNINSNQPCNLVEEIMVKKKRVKIKDSNIEVEKNSVIFETQSKSVDKDILNKNLDYKNICSKSLHNENLSTFSDKTNKLKKKDKKKSLYLDVEENLNQTFKGRHYTISIALPASILEETCLKHVLRTYVIGQLSRAACIYSIDEIIVYNDMQWRNNSTDPNRYLEMMKMILEYQECPQYLRKDFFPEHEFMVYAGVLNALNAPHHLRAYDWCDYREGVVLSQCHGKWSCVNVGFDSPITVDKNLEPGLRVTVKLPPEIKILSKSLYGYVVSPEEPRTEIGMYWGYSVRIANSLSEVFKSERFEGGYDLIIGTSDKGTDATEANFEEFNHALIVFGGVDGLEAAMSVDEKLSHSDVQSFFPYYLNVCPNQSSRTIRTEEAVFISLATLCPKLTKKGVKKKK